MRLPFLRHLPSVNARKKWRHIFLNEFHFNPSDVPPDMAYHYSIFSFFCIRIFQRSNGFADFSISKKKIFL